MSNITIEQTEVIKTTIDPRSVLFLFRNYKPVCSSLDYLYREGPVIDYQTYSRTYVDDEGNIVHYDNEMGPGNPLRENEYQYTLIDSINRIKLYVGSTGEYYKNIDGYWVDMTILRKNIHLFSYIIIESPTIQNSNLRPYYVADKLDFSTPNELIDQMKVDVSDIPKTSFIDNNGDIFNIDFNDGTLTENHFDKLYFDNVNIPSIYPINNDNIKFSIRACSVAFNTFAPDIGTDEDGNEILPLTNEYEKFDDIELTFTKLNTETGNNDPYTDLDNMLIFVNKKCLNYIINDKNVEKNSIFIKNVVKDATIETVGVKSNIDVNALTINHEVDGIDSCYVNLSLSDKQLKYKYDIRIYKWNNVSISKQILPLNVYKVLKNEPITNRPYYLTTSLVYPDNLNDNKFIVIRDGIIMSKNEYNIDPNNRNTIILKYASIEFDALLTDLKTVYDKYIVNPEVPSQSDYATIDEYITAMEQYIYDNSKIDLRKQIDKLHNDIDKFLNRKYSIVTFDTIGDVDDLYLYENYDNLKLNIPLKNEITIENFKPTDILIFNGLNVRLENKYDEVFVFPTTNKFNYSYFNNVDLFKNSNSYKLDMLRIPE